MSFITKPPALLECIFIFCSLLLGGFSPHVPCTPRVVVLPMTCPHVRIALPSPDNRPSSVMCYRPSHSPRGNDHTDYVNMTAAEYISASTRVHFLHTSHRIALAPLLQMAPEPTYPRSSFYFMFNSHMLLSSISLLGVPSGPDPVRVSVPHLRSVKQGCANC